MHPTPYKNAGVLKNLRPLNLGIRGWGGRCRVLGFRGFGIGYSVWVLGVGFSVLVRVRAVRVWIFQGSCKATGGGNFLASEGMLRGFVVPTLQGVVAHCHDKT